MHCGKDQEVLDYCSEDSCMNKDHSICFRTSIHLRNALEEIARMQKKSLSSTIEDILGSSLQERKAFMLAGQERRRFPRRKLGIPARIAMPGPYAAVQQGALVDLSLSGLRYSIPSGLDSGIAESQATSTVSVAFTLPGGNRPLTLECAVRHRHRTDVETSVGTSFTNADFTSYQALQDYLID
jgi:hypothetical protein